MFFRIAPLFLIDPGSNGGLALSPQELGLVLGTVGTFSLIGGCALGATLVRKDGLKPWRWLFVVALTLPKFIFVYLSYYFVSTLSIINMSMIVEQFGTGLGLTVYIVWLAHCTKGEHSTFSYHSFLFSDDRLVYGFLARVCRLSSLLPSSCNLGYY